MLVSLRNRLDRLKIQSLAGFLVIVLFLNTVVFSNVSARIPEKNILNESIFSHHIESDKLALNVDSNVAMLALMGLSAAMVILPQAINFVTTRFKNYVRSMNMNLVEKEAIKEAERLTQQSQPQNLLPAIAKGIEDLSKQLQQNTQSILDKLLANDIRELRRNMDKISLLTTTITNMSPSYGPDSGAVKDENGNVKMSQEQVKRAITCRQSLSAQGVAQLPSIIDDMYALLIGENWQGIKMNTGVLDTMIQKMLTSNEYAENLLDTLNDIAQSYCLFINHAAYIYVTYHQYLCISDNGLTDESLLDIYTPIVESFAQKAQKYTQTILKIPNSNIIDQRGSKILVDNKNGSRLWLKVATSMDVNKAANTFGLSGGKASWSHDKPSSWQLFRNHDEVDRITNSVDDVNKRNNLKKILALNFGIPTFEELKGLLEARDSDQGSNNTEILTNRKFEIGNNTEFVVAESAYEFKNSTDGWISKIQVYDINTGKLRKLDDKTKSVCILWMNRDRASSTGLTIIPMDRASTYGHYSQVVGFEDKQKINEQYLYDVDASMLTKSKKSYKYTAPANKVITRVEVEPLRADYDSGKNGAYAVSGEGPYYTAGGQSVEVTFESSFYRAMLWRITIYCVTI